MLWVIHWVKCSFISFSNYKCINISKYFKLEIIISANSTFATRLNLRKASCFLLFSMLTLHHNIPFEYLWLFNEE